MSTTIDVQFELGIDDDKTVPLAALGGEPTKQDYSYVHVTLGQGEDDTTILLNVSVDDTWDDDAATALNP